jgi:hypothetical protein
MAGGSARDGARVRGTDPGGAARRLAVPGIECQANRDAAPVRRGSGQIGLHCGSLFSFAPAAFLA